MTTQYERFAGLAAILAGLVGLLYSVSFVVLQNNLLSAVFLLAGGLLSLVALVALFNRLAEADAGFALLGLMLAGVSALGAAIHGAYDLANAIHPPVEAAGAAGLPNAIDPRGFLTFGLAGLAVLVAAVLMGRGGRFPNLLRLLTFVLGLLLLIIYLGRLIVLDPTSPLILAPAALTGFILNPVWYIWLGLELRKGWSKSAVRMGAAA
ncbi:MAG: hypothetical protein K1X65_07495 [Caldilineales bacterium]|nr:hypothetical protein [Caldilineales bacterium]MCW5859825.1 hypothetical protein [Caldilineales bacterium]